MYSVYDVRRCSRLPYSCTSVLCWVLLLLLLYLILFFLLISDYALSLYDFLRRSSVPTFSHLIALRIFGLLQYYHMWSHELLNLIRKFISIRNVYLQTFMCVYLHKYENGVCYVHRSMCFIIICVFIYNAEYATQ